MAYQTVGKRNRRWAEENRVVARAAASARAAGVSEDAIYKSLRRQLKDPPSIRDLRASFEHYHATHGKIGGKKDRTLNDKGRAIKQKSHYQERAKMAYSPKRRELLAGNYTMSALIDQDKKRLQSRGEPASKEAPSVVAPLLVKEAYFVEWEESQDYNRSPPL